MTPERDLLRAHVHGAIEEASGRAISFDDPTADELVAAAEAVGAPSATLLAYIYDSPKPDGWSAPDFARWHKEHGGEPCPQAS